MERSHTGAQRPDPVDATWVPNLSPSRSSGCVVPNLSPKHSSNAFSSRRLNAMRQFDNDPGSPTAMQMSQKQLSTAVEKAVRKALGPIADVLGEIKQSVSLVEQECTWRLDKLLDKKLEAERKMMPEIRTTSTPLLSLVPPEPPAGTVPATSPIASSQNLKMTKSGLHSQSSLQPHMPSPREGVKGATSSRLDQMTRNQGSAGDDIGRSIFGDNKKLVSGSQLVSSRFTSQMAS